MFEALFIAYGTGFVLGYLSNDTVTLGGVTAKNIEFGQVLYMANFFSQVPIDGILGLAFPLIATDKVLPVLDAMWAQGLLSKFMFSTYLSSAVNSSSSVLFLGGVDESYYTGSIVWADVLLPSYWLVGMGSVAVNNATVHHCGAGYCPTVIDTGTSILLFSPEVGNPVIARLLLSVVLLMCEFAIDFEADSSCQVRLLQPGLAAHYFLYSGRRLWWTSPHAGAGFLRHSG